MKQGGGIRGPSTASPGTTVEVEVDAGGEVAVTVPGQAPTRHPVRGGKASVPVPPGVPAGTLLHVVVLGRIPPEGITIVVIETLR